MNQPDWSDDSHGIALGALLRRERLRSYLMLNAYWKPLPCELPALAEQKHWRRWIDTSLESPQDIHDWTQAPRLTECEYLLEA